MRSLARALVVPASSGGLTTITIPNLVTTSTDGLVLQNTTAATSGVTVQISPRARWVGTAWDTAASQTVAFFAEVLPATAATPTGTWKLGYSRNGGAATYPFMVDSVGVLTTQSTMQSGGNVSAGSNGAFTFNSVSKSALRSSSDGILSVETVAATFGSKFKVDALPTVASGFGTSPAVTAGSTALAGSVNVGTIGAAETSGVIAFNGTAFPSAPFVIAMNTTTGALLRATTTTTQLTITANAAFTTNDVVCWICISSK